MRDTIPLPRGVAYAQAVRTLVGEHVDRMDALVTAGLVVYERRRTETPPPHRRERWPVLVWATLTLSESGGFHAPAEDVEILRLTETT